MPNGMPEAMMRVQLLGRAKPSARHGVRDVRAHASTSTALRGLTAQSPARMTRITRIRSGPNPRRSAATRSSGDAAAVWIMLNVRGSRSLLYDGRVGELPVLREAVAEIEPRHFAADEDVVLGFQTERRVEAAGGHVDVLRLARHGAGEARSALAAEAPPRAGLGREADDLALALEK